MRTMLRTKELTALLGFTDRALEQLRQDCRLQPHRPGRPGKGNGALWTLPQAMALLVGKALRTHGVVRREFKAAMLYFWLMPQNELLAKFAEGRTHLLVVGERCLPRLVGADAIANNEHIPYQLLAQLGVRAWGLNIKTIWDNVQEAVAKLPEPVHLGVRFQEACQ